MTGGMSNIYCIEMYKEQPITDFKSILRTKIGTVQLLYIQRGIIIRRLYFIVNLTPLPYYPFASLPLK